MVLNTGAMVSAAPSGPGGALPELGTAVVSRLPAGGIAVVRPEQGAPVAAIELWYRAPSTGFGTKPQPGLARLAAQAVAASKPIVGKSLGDTVADAGGRLFITVYSDSLEIASLVPAPAASSVIKAMTTAYFAPVLSPDGFRSAQTDVGQEALFSSADVGDVVRDAIFAQLFRDGPQHFSTYGEPKVLAGLPFADVQDFATRAFRADNATLVISGAIDPSIAAAAVSGRADEVRSSGEPVRTGTLEASRTPVTHAGSEASGGFGWVGPGILDEREATAMDFIADYLFRPDTGVVSSQSARRDPKALVIGQFITLHDPGVMFVGYGGTNAPDVGTLISKAAAAMQQPLAASAFAAARVAFEFHLLSDLQTPLELADNFGWYTVEGNAAYAPGAGGEHGAYFAAADSLTPDFVAAVARKYLGRAPALVTFTPNPVHAAAP